jgi:hypothetical protein
VIATNTCVLPELVTPGVNGHLLPFENDAIVGKWVWLYRNADPDYLDAYRGATERISAALFEQLAASWENRRDYEALSAGALAAAHNRFHPDIARARLEALYERFGPL